MFRNTKQLHENWWVIISAVTINTILLGWFNHVDHKGIEKNIINEVRFKN